MGRTPAPTLEWAGKHDVASHEPRTFVPVDEHSYASETHGTAATGENLLIHADNLDALTWLESSHTGTVQCIYIDPPYNTGSAFRHYDDASAHGAWLSFMRDRLALMRPLLAPTGVILVSINEDELGYLIVLMDELFGRTNRCGVLVWEKKRKPAFLHGHVGSVTEYVLAYARDIEHAPPFIGGVTTAGKKYPVNNAGNTRRVISFAAGSVQFAMPDGTVEPQDMSEGNIVTHLLDPVVIREGRNVGAFRLDGEWRYSQARIEQITAAGESIVISRIPFRPNHVKRGGEPKKMRNLLTVAHDAIPTYEDAAAESEALFGAGGAFDYPKPEALIARLIGAVTQPGDLVLDAFLGSGTTAAVAHKMGRPWIGIERGEHAVTHCVPRLRKVIDGEDQGGVTVEMEWRGGGGFRFVRG